MSKASREKKKSKKDQKKESKRKRQENERKTYKNKCELCGARLKTRRKCRKHAKEKRLKRRRCKNE